MSLKLKEAFDPEGEDAIERAAKDYERANAAVEAEKKKAEARETVVPQGKTIDEE